MALLSSRTRTGAPPPHPQSESAHTVNVWCPANPPPHPGEDLPVLVWVHGGGLESGCASSPLYDGGSFVAAREAAGQRVIVVSGNYRTGVFGWGTGAGWESLDEGGKGLAGNWGLWDVVGVFRWVRENVGGFGGSGERVTAFGESAGAFLVGCLGVGRERLFSRVVLQSGGVGTLPLRVGGESYRPYKGLVERFAGGATLPAARRAVLKSLPAEELLQAHVDAPGQGKVAVTVETGPHAVFTASTLERLERGELSPWVKGVIIGTLEDEGVPFSFTNPLCWRAEGVGRLLGRYDEGVRREAMRLFPDDPEGERKSDFTTAPVSRWIHEHTFEQPADLLARTLVKVRKGDCPVYMYRFNTPIEGMKWGSGSSNYGVPHGMELAATFNIEALLGEKGSPAWKAADEMGRRWVDFASGKGPGEDWLEWDSSDPTGAGTSWQEGRGYAASEESWQEGRGYGSNSGSGDGSRKWLVFKPDGNVEMQDYPKADEQKKFVQSLLIAKEDELKAKIAAQAEKASKAGKGAKL